MAFTHRTGVRVPDRESCFASCNSLRQLFPHPSRGVGFLKYYEIRQLPNFVLAAPVLIFALYSTFAPSPHGNTLVASHTCANSLAAVYMYVDRRPRSFFSIGTLVEPKSATEGVATNHTEEAPRDLIYYYYLCVQLLICFTILHGTLYVASG